ncbi:DJ-1 family glyoxalase III [Clostridium sp. Ade.TY]|uniref:DJ-1 family glyoxalase III n=1 Tax=Clostridium sp. Ade.TY TaxID=1391647 RepID=UPI0003F848A2|nr:DJ-1 family glyoxalase III [Clostridium sp. Ade.TY]
MKKVCVLLANGFEEIEALTVVDVLRRANIECNLVSIDKEYVTGAHNITVKADLLIDDVNYVDMVVLPGGMPGATNLRDNSKVINLIQNVLKDNKKVAAICAAPIVLDKASVIDGKDVTSYPGFENELRGANYKEDLVVVSGNIITSRGPATALEFSYNILKELGSDKEKSLREEMLYNLVK